MRSMFGVVFTFDPYALIACAAWSSDMMNRMFGRCSGWACATPTKQNITAAVIKSRFTESSALFGRQFEAAQVRTGDEIDPAVEVIAPRLERDGRLGDQRDLERRVIDPRHAVAAEEVGLPVPLVVDERPGALVVYDGTELVSYVLLVGDRARRGVEYEEQARIGDAVDEPAGARPQGGVFLNTGDRRGAPLDLARREVHDVQLGEVRLLLPAAAGGGRRSAEQLLARGAARREGDEGLGGLIGNELRVRQQRARFLRR